MEKVEFAKNGKITWGEHKTENRDVYVDGKLFGELTHENAFEWYLIQYVNGERNLMSNTVSYYDDLEETENEIKFEIENY